LAAWHWVEGSRFSDSDIQYRHTWRNDSWHEIIWEWITG
jgi:hypothetical protein